MTILKIYFYVELLLLFWVSQVSAKRWWSSNSFNSVPNLYVFPKSSKLVYHIAYIMSW